MKDLNVIFAKYFQDKAYSDVMNNGVIYRCQFEKLLTLKGSNGPYQVSFTSILSISLGNGTIVRFRIFSDGEIMKSAPQFPENVTGFFFNSLTQRVERMSDISANGDSITVK